MKPLIKVNSNFHHVEGENLFVRNDSEYREYRKRWDEWPQKFHVGEFPLFIDLEVTSICNLKCPFCATTYRGDKIKRGYITFDVVKKIIDEGAQHGLYGVKFNIRGEPLLHKEIDKFVQYAKSKGLIDVYFNTNAMLLDEAMSLKLIKAGLDRISISFEGFTKEVYEKHRVAANYETVIKNISTLQELKKKLNVQHPKVRVQTVLLPELVPTFEEYKKFWKSRADEVGFLDYKKMKKKIKGVKYSWACPQLWQRMGIWWDGTILPCNHDDDGSETLGNANEMSIKDAWNSQRLNILREKHKSGSSHEIPICDGCYLRDSEIHKLMNEEAKS